jgi:hypothetical protein
MTKSQSQLSYAVWEITEELCPRIIVTDGRIQCVSTMGGSHLFVNKLWLPSSITLFSWKNVYNNQNIKSVVIENKSKLGRIEGEGFKNTGLNFITIPVSVGFLGPNCFSCCGSLSSVTFGSGSRLSRIGREAFIGTGLIEIVIPSSVELIGENCFFNCRSLSSVIFESGSKLSGIENRTFCQTGLVEIIVPSSVEILGESCFSTGCSARGVH